MDEIPFRKFMQPIDMKLVVYSCILYEHLGNFVFVEILSTSNIVFINVRFGF